MELSLPKTNILLDRNFIIAFLLLALISSVLHELGHYVINIALGGDVYMTFSAVMPKDPSAPISADHWLLALTGGPMVSYFLIYLGLYLLLFSKRFQLLGTSLVLINAPARVLSAFDETKIFSILGLDPGLVYLYLIPLFVLIPIIVVYMSIVNKRKYLIIGGLILLSLAFGAIRVTIDKEFFMNPFFEEGYIFPDVFGINIYMVILSLIALALFFGKYVQYLFTKQHDT